MSLAENIVNLRKARGLSRVEFSNQIKYKNSTVQGWEMGSIPRQGTLKKIAEFFGVSVAELMFTDAREGQEDFLHSGVTTPDKTETINSDPVLRVPMRAGVGGAAYFSPFDGEAIEYIDTRINADPNTEAVRITGNSMLPAYPSGTTLFYSHRDENVHKYVGRVAICILNDQRVLIKVIMGGDSNCFTLRSLNPDEKDIENVEVAYVLPIDYVEF